MNKSDSLKTFKKRLEFSLIFVLFFPTLLIALHESAGFSGQDALTLKWSFLIPVFVLCYIFLEVYGKKLSSIVLKIANVLLLVQLFMYAVVIYVFVGVQGATLSMFYKLPFIISTLGIIIIPTVILVIFLGNFLYPHFKKLVQK